MLAQQLRESSSLFDSLDALRDWRALLLLVLVFMAAAVVWAAGGWMLVSTGHSTPLFLCAALAVALLLWGVNSAGLLMMDQSAGRPGRTLGQVMRASLGATQQLILVLLALALFYLIGLLALTVLVLVCSVPVLGPWLYVLVFPVGAVASGLALFILPTLVIPLCAPAIWCGLDASTGLAQLWAAMRHRLVLVLSWMLLLYCITAAVGLVLAAVLLLGFSVTSSVSAAILGSQQTLWPGIDLPSVTAPGGSSAAAAVLSKGGQGALAYMQAAALGGTALWAAVCAVPCLIAMRGICIIYRRTLLGLSTAQEEQALSQTLAAARNRARELRGSIVPKAAAHGDGAAVPPGAAHASSFSSSSPAVPRPDRETSQVHLMMQARDEERAATAAVMGFSNEDGAGSPSSTQPSPSWLTVHQQRGEEPGAVATAGASWSPPASSARVPTNDLRVPQPSWLQQYSATPPLGASSSPPAAAADAAAAPATTAAPLDLDLDLGTPLVEGALPLDGRTAALLTICPFCGGDTEKTDFFCGHCGHALPK